MNTEFKNCVLPESLSDERNGNKATTECVALKLPLSLELGSTSKQQS
jgi:hypothetical protein